MLHKLYFQYYASDLCENKKRPTDLEIRFLRIFQELKIFRTIPDNFPHAIRAEPIPNRTSVLSQRSNVIHL